MFRRCIRQSDGGEHPIVEWNSKQLIVSTFNLSKK
jgi:hypothetical protein